VASHAARRGLFLRIGEVPFRRWRTPEKPAPILLCLLTWLVLSASLWAIFVALIQLI